MTPAQYAEELGAVAVQSTLLGGTQKARDELLPLFFYFTVNWTRMEDPTWLTQVQELLERASRISRPDFMQRLASYDAAANNKTGRGPMWFTTKAYAGFVQGQLSADLDQAIPLSMELAAAIAIAKDVAERHLSA